MSKKTAILTSGFLRSFHSHMVTIGSSAQPWLPELPFGGWAGSGPLIAGTVGIAKPGKYPAPGAAALIPDHLHLLPRDNEAVLFPLASSGKAIPDKQIIVWNISSMCSSAALPASQSQLDLL